MTRDLTCLDGTPVRPFAFGAMQFGDKAEETASRALYDACRAAGITHFDTANGYTEGASETLTGQFIAPEREAIFLATKVGYAGGAGAANLTAQFDLSRHRLGLDQVDALYLHRFDPDTDLRTTMEWFARARDAGHLRHVGLSNFAAWQVMKAIAIAAEFDLTIDLLQPMYNLVKRQAEVELLPMCADQNIHVAAYSPLGGGLLTGKYAGGGDGRLTQDHRYAARYGPAWMHEAASGLTAIAQREGVDPTTLAVAWVAQGRFAVTPILSASAPMQLGASLAGMEMTLSPDLMAEITALSPAPPPATDRIEEAR